MYYGKENSYILGMSGIGHTYINYVKKLNIEEGHELL